MADKTVVLRVTVDVPADADTDDLVQFVSEDLAASMGQLGGTNPITDVTDVRVMG